MLDDCYIVNTCYEQDKTTEIDICNAYNNTVSIDTTILGNCDTFQDLNIQKIKNNNPITIDSIITENNHNAIINQVDETYDEDNDEITINDE